MTRLQNGFQRKKIVSFSLWEDVGVLQRDWILNKGPKKSRKCCKSVMAEPTSVCELFGCSNDPCDFAR